MIADSTVPPIHHIRVAGTARQRGVSIGELSEKKIQHSLSTYERLFSLCDISWTQAVEKSSQFVKAVDAISPDYIIELEGVAEGAGVDFESLLALNSRTEILPSNFLSKAMASSDSASFTNNTSPLPNTLNECTSLAVTGDEKNYWLAQNWDWCGLQRQAMCVVESHPDAGGSHITVTEAGMLAKIGINSHGLAITLNILRSERDGISEGVPVHFLLRALLDCQNVEEAISLVSSLSFCSSSNVMVQDATGKIASFELSPYGVKILEPDNNVLCHTNHFLDNALTSYDVGRPGNDSTINRLSRAQSYADAHMSESDIKQMLCDQNDGLESICRFADPTHPEIAQIETVTAVIMNTSKKTLSVSGAQPSMSDFKTYSL